MLAFCLLSGALLGQAPGEARTTFANSIRMDDPRIAPQLKGQIQSPDPNERLQFMVSLKMRNNDDLQARISKGEVIPLKEMAEKYLPLPVHHAAIVAWLQKQGFSIDNADSTRIGIIATGTISQIQQALGTRMAQVVVNGTPRPCAIAPPSLPSSIAPPVLGITGLHPSSMHGKSGGITPSLLTSAANGGEFLPSDLLKAYNATGLNLTGTGQTIGIVIDSYPNDSDLSNFWSQTGVSRTGTIEHFTVGTGNLAAPASSNSEQTLDAEWASSIAPGAKIRIYGVPNLFTQTSQEYQAYQQIINDLPSQPGMRQVSLSYGGSEAYNSTSILATRAQYFSMLASQGVTVFVASGDGGSNPGMGGHDHTGALAAETPASDPNVIAVGGTALTVNSDGSVNTEPAWYDGGGGVSSYFSRPSWQTGSGVPAGSKRVVPDVALVSAEYPGAWMILGGQYYRSWGTSWSAPVWAGFCAMINQSRASAGQSSLGSLGPKIYPLISTANFRDITTGNNGTYSAAQGYDLCTGLGVPKISNLVQSLTNHTTSLPNLTFFQPSGWSDKVVVSNVKGTNTDSSPLLTTNTLYVDFAPWNNGNATVGAAWHAQVFVDNVLALDIPFTSGLAPSYYYNAVLDYAVGPLTAGSHTIKVVLDSGNTVGESNEGDNVFYKNITVTANGLPNLAFYKPAGWSDDVVVSNVTGTNTDTSPLHNTDSLYVDFAPQNNGNATVGNAWHGIVYVDNIQVYDQSFSSGLTAGTYYNNTLDKPIGSLPVGTHTIKVVLDAGNTVGESNESDNAYYKTITITSAGQSNLTFYQPSGWSDKVVVSNVTGTNADSAPLGPNDTLYVDFAPLNAGTFTTASSWDAKIYIDGVAKNDVPFGSGLSPNYYYTGNLDYNIGSLPTGTHTIQIVLDVNNTISESNESDNSYTKTITIASANHPNLTFYQPQGWTDKVVISNVTGTNTDTALFYPTDKLYLDFAPWNAGNLATPAAWQAKIYVDGVVVDTESFSAGLGANTYYNNMTDKLIGSLTAGTHNVQVVLDTDNTIAESNENDNSYQKTVTVLSGSPLTSNVPINNLLGSTGSEQLYSIVVPAGTKSLLMSISGGTGDADMYLLYGAPPTTNSYAYRPYLAGNNESVTVQNPTPGVWYVMVNGYDDYSGVTLRATLSQNSWVSSQLTTSANMADGARTGVAQPNANLYFYKGTDNNIWAVFLAGNTWAQQQLTTLANVADWLAYDPPFSTLNYKGTDGNLWCVYYNSAAAQWTSQQLGTLPQGVTIAGDIVVDNYGGWNNIYYRGSDSHLYAVYFNGSAWVHVAIGGTATVKGSLAIQGNNHLVYYQGTDNNLWCFYYNGKVWTQLQLTTTGNVAGTVAVDNVGFTVYYKSNVDNSAWCGYSAGGPWSALQLDASANLSTSATSFSNLAPYNANDCTLYLDNNGQCNSLYWNGKAWAHVLLGDGGSQITGGLSLQPINHWLFARRSDGNVLVFYIQ